MLTNCAFDNVILKILIILRFSFISFFRHNLIAISNDFIFHINNIRLAEIITFIISNFTKIFIYEAHRYLNVNENYKDHRFTYNITLHIMLKFVFFYSIKDISRIII